MWALILGLPWLVCGMLFAALLLALEAGRRLGRSRLAAGQEAGTGAMDGAVYALLGLLLAFTFSGAAQRFDERRAQMVQEANAIGTAQLRVDLAPPQAQPALRAGFARYVESRIAAYALAADPTRFAEALRSSTAIQHEIWDLAVAAGRAGDAAPGANQLLLPALNEMFDITTTRSFAMLLHPPGVIYALLVALALGSALLAGHGLAGAPHRPWLHMVSYAGVMTAAIFIIIDMEYPRLGLIRLDSFEQVLIRMIRPG